MTQLPLTQLQAWERLVSSGKLSLKQAEVCRLLERHPAGLTPNEIDHALAPYQSNAAFSRRTAELERLGMVRRNGRRVCTHSGHSCTVWVRTERTTPLPRVKTTPLKTLLATLRATVAKIAERDDGPSGDLAREALAATGGRVTT